jgi:hypothetical protein
MLLLIHSALRRHERSMKHGWQGNHSWRGIRLNLVVGPPQFGYYYLLLLVGKEPRMPVRCSAISPGCAFSDTGHAA